MADKKISQLPAATTPLAGTEVLPIVQNDVTDKVSVANLTAGRSVSAASLTLTTSPLAIASGGTNQTAFTAPSSSIAGLVWFDGTSFQNDTTTSHVGYNASTNVFYANTPTFTGNTTLSTGNLVIGTSGKGITTGSAIPLGFGTNTATTGMTLDTNNNLLLGTTSASQNADNGIKIRPAGQGAGAPDISIVTAGSTGGSTSYNLYSTGAGAYRFYVTNAGSIYATSTSITGISDQTLKKNIRDLETGLSEVMALQPRRFDWINGDGENVAGFVAQEVEKVLPELVVDFKYNDSETKKSLKMGDMLPTLVKAIQEQQAQIEQLKTEIIALKKV